MTLKKLIDLTNNLSKMFKKYNFNDVNIEIDEDAIHVFIPGKICIGTHDITMNSFIPKDIEIEDIKPTDFKSIKEI